MTGAKLVFILMALFLFGVVPFFIKQRKLYYIGLASSLYIFSSGWIFYHFNGIMLGDIPIFTLLVLAMASSRKINFAVKPVGIPLLLLIAAFVLSAAGAVRPGWVISESTKYFRMYLLVIGIAANIHTLRELKAAVTGMLIGLLLQALLGIYQWRWGALGIWFLGERPPDRISWRTMGTFFVPSFYANYLAMMLPLAFRMFVYFKSPNTRWTWFYGSAFFVGLLALFTTYGRGPWIGFAVAIVLTMLWSLFRSRFKSRIKWTLPIVIVFALLFSVRYGNAVMTQFTSSRRVSTEVRFPQFRIAWRVIKANPVKGVGLGNYDLNSWDYMTVEEQRNPYARVYAMMVHNVYLYITAEAGFFGGIMLLVWIISIFVLGVQLLHARVVNDYIVNVGMGIFGGVLAIAIIFTFSPDIHAYQLLYQLGLFCGLLFSMKQMTLAADRRKRLQDSSNIQEPVRSRVTIRNQKSLKS